MNNSNFKIKKLTPIFLLFILVACTPIDAYLDGEKETINTHVTDFYITSSMSMNALNDSLLSKGIIEDTAAFQSVVEYKELIISDFGSGKYKIKPNTSIRTLVNGFTLNRLGNGNKEVEVEVTFNNCRDVYDLAGKVSKQIEMDSTSFIHYILSDSILEKYGFSKDKIGALFLPNTYRFYWDTDASSFVERMATAFRSFWNPERMEKIKAIGLDGQSDVVTLASIVYKEQSKLSEEWNTIAGLYLNRLERGVKLQSDPTFRYCWGDKLKGVERLTYKHRAIDCPYNTYLYAGLPPGPICIPSEAVVDAVLNAEDNDYLFMCAQPNYSGRHNFAITLSQHNRNANQYHSWLNSQN